MHEDSIKYFDFLQTARTNLIKI